MNAICENTIGSRNCTCNDGFSGNGTNCFGRVILFYFILFIYLFNSYKQNKKNMKCDRY